MKTIAAIVLAAGLALAQHASSPIPKIKFSDNRLDNGLRVLIAEDHYAPVYAICIAYKVGSKDEKQGRTGFAHLFEHMMFKGSENVGVGELDFLIDTNGGNSNGTTNTDRTSYYEVLPKNQLDLGLFLEADRMHGLVITPENLENQRQAVKEERRQSVNNQAYGKTSEKLEELIYDNFAYHHPVVGSMTDLDAASVDDVKQFFKTYYAPNNAVLALAGDLDTKETLAKVKKYFGAIPRQEPPKPVDLTEAPKDAERRAVVEDPLARLTRIDMAYRIPASGNADARALGIAASILGGGGGGGPRRRGRRQQFALVSQARRREGNRQPGFLLHGPARGPGHVPHFGHAASRQDAQEAEGLIAEEIARLHAEPVTDRELARVRIGLRRAAENRFTALSRAQALADAAAVYDDPNRVNTEIDAQLAVSPADIQKAAKACLLKANSVVVVTTPAGGGRGPGRGGRGGN